MTKLREEKLLQLRQKSVRVACIGDERISVLARMCHTDAAKPIYTHWFGLEVLKTYESATQNLSDSTNINIALDGSTYEIKRDSLRNATAAIKTACEICQDTESSECRSGFMSNSRVRNTEQAFTCLVSRALDRFLFPIETTGACLHQPPVHILIVNFVDFLPGDPISCTAMKIYDFDDAERETVLYNGAAVEEGYSRQFPVLLGLPCTFSKLELQLHISVNGKICKLVVAHGVPWDEALLCTVYASVHYLMENDMLVRSKPLTTPEPFKNMKGYSICGETNRVFRAKETDVVFKFFDTKNPDDSFFKPLIMMDLIDKCPSILPQVKLACTIGSRVYELTHKYIPGRERARGQYKLKDFLGVVQTLSRMHQHEFVHGDVRLANMVFSEDGTSYLIDFDFVGEHGASKYSRGFNSGLAERHPGAGPNIIMKMEHDRYALAYVIEQQCQPSAVLFRILSLLEETTTMESLEEIETLMSNS
jgi:hypothetical protein